MNPWLFYTAAGVVGYLVGSIPFGYLVARLAGINITQQGSGNIGATNVGRLLGRRFGILVFALDFAKGALPAAAAMWATPLAEASAVVAGVVAGLAAFLGHVFSIFMRLRGGKGVATGAGVVLVLLPVPTLAALTTWAVLVCTFRYVSLASLAAALVLALLHVAFASAPFAGDEFILTIFCVVAVGLVFVRHRGNISRLVRGTENRLNEGPTMQLTTKIVHVLAVGLWFGMAVFFSFPVALTLFGSFEAEARKDERPSWFPLPAEFKQDSGVKGVNFQKDQGTRAAGFAISPLFTQYFLLQGICGFLATLTALGWARANQAGAFIACALVLILALVMVILSWPIERHVSALRETRNEASDILMAQLKAAPAGAAAENARAQVVAIREDFAMWHLWSLLLNMVTILLVTVAMAMTAVLPERMLKLRANEYTEENTEQIRV